MAIEEKLSTISIPAAADLSSSQYLGIKIDTNGRAALATESVQAIGILQDNPAALGRAACVAFAGVSKVFCGGTLNAGDRFCFNSAGKAVALASGDDWSMGVMLEGGANGTISRCLIQPTGAHGLGGRDTP